MYANSIKYSISSFLFCILLFNIIPTAQSQPVRAIEPGPNYLFENGFWFNGDGFEKRTFFVSNGFLTLEKPSQIDSTIDLSGKYIVPPYGEAHNHNLIGQGPTEFDSLYLKHGIFYVKNPNNMPRWRPPRGRVKMLNAADAVFAHGGITVSGGHPNGLLQRNIRFGIYMKEDSVGGFLWRVDDIDDFNRQWDIILSSKPDFIKTYLLYSEEYEHRKNDSSYFNRKGLNPEILNLIVHKAHERGLRVSTHIETATDFHHAVLAGSDEVNHMPGFRIFREEPLERFIIQESDAKLAAEKGITVVTTLQSHIDSTAVKNMYIKNLELLKNSGVRIAIGTDRYRDTSWFEARYLASLGVFTNLELLKMWCENTPATIFPDRKIGKLMSGYEANFLVLNANPLENIEHTQSIALRVKQGRIIKLN